MSPELGQGLKAYRRVQVETMSPAELILLTYDVAIHACDRRDLRRASEAVFELMNGLDFAYEPAGQLVVMYDWIYRQIKEGHFEESRKFLVELRQTWAQAFENDPNIRKGMERLAADASG